MINGNVFLWSNVKPTITVNGSGNLIIFGEVSDGQLFGAINGHRNICYVGGGIDRIGLRLDARGDGSFLYVGNRTKIIGGHAVLGAADPPTNLFIGERSMLSSQVSLRATDSHGIVDLATETVINPPSSIVIEPHVWIGENASVLKGAHIGAGSIIGAGSLVTQPLPPRAICAGVPARVIRTGVTWTNKPNPTIEDIRRQKHFLDKVSPALEPD